MGSRALTGTSRARARGGRAAAANWWGGRRGRFIFKFCLHSLSRALVPPSCLFHFPLPETAVAAAPARRGAGACGYRERDGDASLGVRPPGHRERAAVGLTVRGGVPRR